MTHELWFRRISSFFLTKSPEKPGIALPAAKLRLSSHAQFASPDPDLVTTRMPPTPLFPRLDIPPAFPQTFPPLFHDGNGGYSKRLPPGPGHATFRRGQHLSKSSLSGRCLFGAFCLACARGEVEDTVQTTIMPLGRKSQLFGEVGIFPSQHCRRRDGLVTVFCFACQRGNQQFGSLLPGVGVSGNSPPRGFSVFRGFVNLFEGGLSDERMV